jgi:small conductance mechanosensitive channel
MQPADLISAPYNWFAANWSAIATAAVILIAGWLLARLAYRLITRQLPKAYGVSRNFAPLLGQTARYGIIIFALVTALSFLGVPAGSLYAVLAAGGLAIALALQNTLANIAAGIMLIWLRPIAVGEYIVGDGVAGVVIEIGLFGTRLRSTSGLYIFTPNLKLWNGAITNHSREPRRRIEVSVTAPDTVNINRVRHLLLDIAGDDTRIQPEPKADVHVVSFTGDTVTLQLRAWVATPDYLPALRDITEKAKNAMKTELAERAQGGKAEVAVADDPHATGQHERTPDLT